MSHQQNQSCCSNHQCGCCNPHKEECGSHENHGDKKCNFASKLLELADQAWMEVLKEKIKEQIKMDGNHLDELAKLISETNKEKWTKRMAEKNCCQSFEEKLKGFFGQACKNK